MFYDRLSDALEVVGSREQLYTAVVDGAVVADRGGTIAGGDEAGFPREVISDPSVSTADTRRTRTEAATATMH